MDNNNVNDEYQNGIAIIGMAGKFPKANDVNEFWNNLCNGVEGVSFYSDEELIQYGVDPSLLKSSYYIKARADIEDIDKFDSEFFGYSSREANYMDPQHRMLLECAWATMEDSGWNPDNYDGKIGVFAGESMSSYMLLNVYPSMGNADSAASLQAAIGNDKDSITTTIAYKLNLTGPAITIQSSSSTSLVAVSMACQSILSYQCDMALAGGISVGPPEKSGYLYQEGGILSHSGHCMSFDSRSNGFVPGSGMGLVLLKRLQDAIDDRDHIYAVIKGFAVNNDGSAKVSYTAPSVNAQAEVVIEAQAVAGIEPDTISYIECHGTGTEMGDPIEIEALTQAFRVHTDRKHFCALGSVKSNIGHLDTAAGVTGLIKASLMLENKKIPPTLHFQKPNEKIDFENSPFYVNTSLKNWMSSRLPRRAGVTSLGMGGTNAHVVLEEAPERMIRKPIEGSHLIVLSAKTQLALDTMTDNLKTFLKTKPSINMQDLSYTLNTGRKEFQFRRYIVGNNIDDIVSKLDMHKRGEKHTSKVNLKSRPIVFLFAGQGSQYINMTKDIYQKEIFYKETVDRCCELLRSYMGFDVREILFPKKGQEEILSERLRQTWITQPTLFIVEYAYAMLLKHWGIEPSVMIGHSIGEYVAACLAGVLTLPEALRIVYQRGLLMNKMASGIMLAVELSEEELEVYLGDNIDIAAINSSQQCVVSGSLDSIEELEKGLEENGVQFSRLKTSHAFHSRMVDEIINDFREIKELKGLKIPKVPFISNVTGTWIKDEEATDIEYWAKQMRYPVQFLKGISELIKNPDLVFLEIGTGVLSSFVVQQSSISSERLIIPSIRNQHSLLPDSVQLLNVIGDAWSKGVKIDWERFYDNKECFRISLPTYPFTQKRHWVEPEIKNNIQDNNLLKSQNSESDEDNLSIEEKVNLIWQELLGVDAINLDDDFFVLGGHSLLVTQLISRLRECANINLTFKQFYMDPTIRGILNFIKESDDKLYTDAEFEQLLKNVDSMSEEEVQKMLSTIEEEKNGE